MDYDQTLLTSIPQTYSECFYNVLGLRAEICLHASCVAAGRCVCFAGQQQQRRRRDGHRVRPRGANQPAGAGGRAAAGQRRLSAAAEPQLPSTRQEPGGE